MSIDLDWFLDVHPGKDGRVRNVTVAYKKFKVVENVHIYWTEVHLSKKECSKACSARTCR